MSKRGSHNANITGNRLFAANHTSIYDGGSYGKKRKKKKPAIAKQIVKAKRKSENKLPKKTKKNKAKTTKNISVKVENSVELEFLIFWKNNISKGTKEFQECLALFLKLKTAKKREIQACSNKNLLKK